VEKLLNKFVTLESVDDVVCDKCQRSASFVKKLTIGKVQHSVCLSVCLAGCHYYYFCFTKDHFSLGQVSLKVPEEMNLWQVGQV